jgi:hypothetical protein
MFHCPRPSLHIRPQWHHHQPAQLHRLKQHVRSLTQLQEGCLGSTAPPRFKPKATGSDTFPANSLVPAFSTRSLLLTRFRSCMYTPMFQHFPIRHLRLGDGGKTGFKDTFMIMGRRSNLTMQVVRAERGMPVMGPLLIILNTSWLASAAATPVISCIMVRERYERCNYIYPIVTGMPVILYCEKRNVM